MFTVGLLARLEATPGKEREHEAFLTPALQMANRESTTLMEKAPDLLAAAPAIEPLDVLGAKV